MKPLKALWNLDFSEPTKRRSNLRREIRERLTVRRRGKGSNAWRRVDALDRRPTVVTWQW